MVYLPMQSLAVRIWLAEAARTEQEDVQDED